MNPHQAHTHQVPECHPAGEQDRLVDGRHPVGHVGVEEGGARRRDDDVAFAKEVEPTTACDAVHRSNDGLPQTLALRADLPSWVVVGEGVEILVRRNIATIDSRAERLLPRSRQHDDPYLFVGTNLTPQAGELVLHSLVERVVHLGPVQRHMGDVVTNGIGDGAEIIRDDQAAHRSNIANAAAIGNIIYKLLSLLYRLPGAL